MSEQMTALEARSFNGYSEKNAIAIESQLDCQCLAYQDVFTYKRWQALGFQVCKGEKSIRLETFRSFESKQKDKSGEPKRYTRPWKSYVFCRCQTQPID